MSRRTLIFTLVGLTIAFSGAGVFRPVALPTEGEPPVLAEAAVSSVLGPSSRSEVDRQVSVLEEKVAAGSTDPKAYAQLAFVYLQRTRSSADPTLLPEAAGLLRRSLSLQSESNYEARLGMASLANARHDFEASVRWARSAIELNHHAASPYGILGDALFELGRYQEAERAYQQMIDVRPDLASYIRASYTFQFKGNNEAAIGAMELALESVPPVGEDAAWLRHQLADIYFGMGRLTEAARENRIGKQLAPGYVPPRVGLSEVAIARGRLKRAIAIMEDAVRRLPSLEYLIKLGDLYAVTGRHDAANELYRATADRLRLYRESGVRPDVDFLLFYADRSLRPHRTLREARWVYRNRPTAASADALAWVLYRQGRTQEARRLSVKALQYPPGDGSFYFHAAAIARDLGEDASATRYLRRALQRRFDLSILQTREARALLGSLKL